MKKPTHWMCRRCKEIKKLGEEIARADAGALCKACQSGNTSAISTDPAAGQEQPATIRPRPQRRNGRDYRGRDES